MTYTETFLQLQDLGVAKIIVRYSGGGDQGCIDEIEVYNSSGKQVPNTPTLKSFTEIIEDYANSIILGRGFENWYENEGGYGQVTIKVPSGEYEVENNIAYTMYDTYHHEGKFQD